MPNTEIPIPQAPEDLILKDPMVRELVQKVEEYTDLESEVKVPYIIPGKVIISPGTWNKQYYSPAAIKQAFYNTDWEDKETRSLFLDHVDRSSREWVGEVKNVQLLNDDTVVGDLIIVDKPTAMKLAYGAKFGISPKVAGESLNGKMSAFKFINNSVVINPAVKTAYINNIEGDITEVKSMEETKEAAPPGAAQPAPIASAPAVAEMAEKKPEPVVAECACKKQMPEEKMPDGMEEMSAIVLNGDWTSFVTDYKKTNPEASFKDIAKAYKAKGNGGTTVENSEMIKAMQDEIAAMKGKLAELTEVKKEPAQVVETMAQKTEELKEPARATAKVAGATSTVREFTLQEIYDSTKQEGGIDALLAEHDAEFLKVLLRTEQANI